jgi:hypothetical protein
MNGSGNERLGDGESTHRPVIAVVRPKCSLRSADATATRARKRSTNTRIGILPGCHYDELIEEATMSETATELIRTFSTLSPQERHAVLIELVRISEADDGLLSDDELAYAGEQIFAMYDAEEADHGETQER